MIVMMFKLVQQHIFGEKCSYKSGFHLRIFSEHELHSILVEISYKPDTLLKHLGTFCL